MITFAPKSSHTLGASRFIKAARLPLLDQALISLANFLTTVLIARALLPEQFGIVTLAYTALFAANTLQGTLVVGPHAVLSADRDARTYADYTTSTAVSQFALAAGFGCIAIVGAYIAGDPASRAVFLAFGVAAIGWQLQEFARRVLYVEDRVAAAVANDLVSYGGQLAVIAALAMLGRLTELTAVLVVGLTSLLAAGVGLLQIRSSLRGRFSVSYVRDNLAYGKWLAGGEAAQIPGSKSSVLLS